GGGGGSTYSVLSTPDNVDMSPVPTNLTCDGQDTVNVGFAGSVQSIWGTLTIENPPNYNTITIDDSADAAVTNTTVSTYTPPGDTAFGSISGLAPGTINFENYDTTSVTIATGTASGDVVNVLASSVTTKVVSHGVATVNVGNA